MSNPAKVWVSMGPPVDGALGPKQVEALYAQYAPVIFRRARALLRRDADAWDAVQEVFMRMLTAGSTFRGEARPMTWVYRVTTNTCFNMLRTRRLREPLLTVVPDEPSTGPDVVEARQHLQVWLQHLDERELSIASLLYLDGLTQQEVADVLELSRKTIVREVEALREKLAALGALP